jgi:hypothetical protein
MNLCVPLTEVLPQNIYFTEKRKNIIIDGVFTKIVYSNACVSLNGLYVYINIYSPEVLHSSPISIPREEQPKKIDIHEHPSDTHKSAHSLGKFVVLNTSPTHANKNNIFMNMSSDTINTNTPYLTYLCQLEKDLLEHYRTFYSVSKNMTYTLKTQLTTNTVSFHVPSSYSRNASVSPPPIPVSIVLHFSEDMSSIKTIKSSHSSLIKPRSMHKLLEEEDKRTYTTTTPKNTYNCLKISGIWENATSFGLTYKWIYATPFNQ